MSKVTLEQLEIARKFVEKEFPAPGLLLPLILQSPEEWASIRTRSYAAYHAGYIYLPPYFNWEFNSRYLVHEMAHYAQDFLGRSYPCHNAKEREAYTVQNTWAKLHGFDLVSEAFIEEVSRCE